MIENSKNLKACKEGHTGQSKTGGREHTDLDMALVSCFSTSEGLSGFYPFDLYTVRVCRVKGWFCKFKTYSKHKVYILYEEMTCCNRIIFLLSLDCLVSSRGMCTNLSCFCDVVSVNTV